MICPAMAAMSGAQLACHQGIEQGLLVPEVLVQRADADPRLRGHGVGGQRAHVAAVQQQHRGVQHEFHLVLGPRLARAPAAK